ncbi:unnamed protein product, partial [Oppiella nova]
VVVHNNMVPVPIECFQPPDSGTCSKDLARVYYDHETRTCKPFSYTGCGGNANRFQSIKNCYRICHPYRYKIRPKVAHGKGSGRQALKIRQVPAQHQYQPHGSGGGHEVHGFSAMSGMGQANGVQGYGAHGGYGSGAGFGYGGGGGYGGYGQGQQSGNYYGSGYQGQMQNFGAEGYQSQNYGAQSQAANYAAQGAQSQAQAANYAAQGAGNQAQAAGFANFDDMTNNRLGPPDGGDDTGQKAPGDPKKGSIYEKQAVMTPEGAKVKNQWVGDTDTKGLPNNSGSISV